MDVVLSILLPAGGLTPLSTFIWLGLVMLAVNIVIGMIKKMVGMFGSG